jgi:hypothetical protein
VIFSHWVVDVCTILKTSGPSLPTCKVGQPSYIIQETMESVMAKKRLIKLKAKLNFNGTSREIDINKVSEINLTDPNREFFYLEKKDETWTLNYTKNLIPEIEKFFGVVFEIEMVKEVEAGV